MSRPCCAFTLVELLVVMVITAVLVAPLLPSVQRSREVPAAMFLLNCPTSNLGVSPFTPGARRGVAPHRSRLGWDELGNTFGPTTNHPMNLGYTDGSVKFVDNKGGWVDYNTLH